MSCIFSGYVPLTLGNNCNNKSGAGQCLSLVKCARVWRILFADKIVSASYKFWKGNSEMHHLWKKRQGITRHRKACPASKGMCHTLPCLSPLIPQSKPCSHGHLWSRCVWLGEGCFLRFGVVAFLITSGVKQLLTCCVAPDSKPIKGTSCLRDKSSWPDCSAAPGVLCAQDSKLRFQWPFTSKV